MIRRLVLAVLVLAVLASTAAAQVHVNGYFRRDGTSVPPHYRSVPDGNPSNNWSAPGAQRGLDHRMILEAGPGYVPPVDPYAFQRGILLGQEIRRRQLELELMQRQLQGGR